MLVQLLHHAGQNIARRRIVFFFGRLGSYLHVLGKGIEVVDQIPHHRFGIFFFRRLLDGRQIQHALHGGYRLAADSDQALRRFVEHKGNGIIELLELDVESIEIRTGHIPVEGMELHVQHAHRSYLTVQRILRLRILCRFAAAGGLSCHFLHSPSEYSFPCNQASCLLITPSGPGQTGTPEISLRSISVPYPAGRFFEPGACHPHTSVQAWRHKVGGEVIKQDANNKEIHQNL
ncbi:hypothetical protein BN871_CF_00100 [Paenibacillus sp. P22]|nr:hypothetical protein BN871_CF_00100 [Paenibacillus sp. P22]